MKSSCLLFLFILLNQFLYGQNEDKQKNSILTDKFLISGGVFFPTKNVNIEADGTLSPEDIEDIEFDEAFGIGNFQTTLSLNFMWRFSKSKLWSLRAEYFNISNSNEAILEEDIEWNDFIFKEGSSVKGGFSMALYKIFFGRVISTGNKHELGGGLGVHLLNVSAFVEGDAGINDDELVFEKSKVSIVAPLPNIGFWYIYAPTEKLSLSARLDWLGIKIGDFGGSLWNISPGVNYQFFKNLGLGVSYKFFRVDVDVDKESWKGNFNMAFSGPAITIIGNF